MSRDWNRSSTDWSNIEPEPVTSAERQVYIDGGYQALREYRQASKEATDSKEEPDDDRRSN